MKDKKKVWKFFSVMEYEQEQEYLRSEHQKGWKVVKVTFPGIYTFVKCEPEDVVYQLDYNPDREKGMEEYVQMFKDCGWEYLCDMAGYSYFRKPVSEMKEEESIFSDESSKKDMINRVFKGRMVPLFIIFGLIICPQLAAHFGKTDMADKVIFGMYVALFVLYFGIFVHWGITYLQFRKK